MKRGQQQLPGHNESSNVIHRSIKKGTLYREFIIIIFKQRYYNGLQGYNSWQLYRAADKKH